MTDYKKALDDIIDLLGDDFDGAVGLRGDNFEYVVGQELRPSKYWEDGIETSELLNGTSAIVISSDYKYDPLIVLENNINKYAKLVEGYGSNVYVIAGDVATGGDDIGEIIIPNAKVIMKIK